MNNPVLLSIIIPIYNKGKYIAKCLSSIIRQSYGCFEIIIINDGSTDDSEDVIQKFQIMDERIKLYSYSNGGVSVARNRGISMAQGKYIMFIDADDWIESGYLQRIMVYVERSDADIYIWGITKQIADKDQVLSPLMNGTMQRRDFFRSFVKEQYMSRKGLYGYVSNKLLRRDIIQKYGLYFNEEIKQLEDYDFFLNYYRYIERICVFDETGYHYVMGTEYSSGMMIRNVNFFTLMEIHLKCRNLLVYNDCLTEENRKLVDDALCGLSIAMFLEMPVACMNIIRQYIKQLECYEEVWKALKGYETRFRCLKSLVLKKSVPLLYIYIYVWKCYLHIRKRI